MTILFLRVIPLTLYSSNSFIVDTSKLFSNPLHYEQSTISAHGNQHENSIVQQDVVPWWAQERAIGTGQARLVFFFRGFPLNSALYAMNSTARYAHVLGIISMPTSSWVGANRMTGI